VTKRHLAAFICSACVYTLSQSAHGDVTVCITFPPLLSIGVITFYYSISLMIINNRGSSLELLPVALLCWPGINSIESYRRHVNGEKIVGGGGGHWATCVYKRQHQHIITQT
jgi:hypothetical protein